MIGPLKYLSKVPKPLVLFLKERFDLRSFVETGTLEGDACTWAARHFRHVHTIEANKVLWENARRRYEHLVNVTFLHGNSPEQLVALFPQLDRPLFWLDAHMVDGRLRADGAECPLLAELAAIAVARIGEFAIVIDDASLFLRPPPPTHDWPQWPDLSAVMTALQACGDLYVMVKDDVIVAVPARGRRDMVEFCHRGLLKQTRRPTGKRSLHTTALPVRRANLLDRAKPDFGFLGEATGGSAKRLLHFVPRRWQQKLLNLLAELHDVESLVVRGYNGAIEGSLRDRTLFAQYLARRIWAPDLLDLILGGLRGQPEGTYIDVGANIGLTAIPTALNTSCSVHAFEPDPENFAALQLNVLRNGLVDRVTVYNTALSDGAGILKPRRAPVDAGDARNAIDDESEDAHGEVKRSTIEVASQPLDMVLSQASLSRPIVVKIDARGAEPLILRGGRKLLSEADLVIMKFWPLGITQLRMDPLQFIEELRQLYGEVKAVETVQGRVLANSFDEIASLAQRLSTGRLSLRRRKNSVLIDGLFE
jgi:FkbM family methyltransferase